MKPIEGRCRPEVCPECKQWLSGGVKNPVVDFACIRKVYPDFDWQNLRKIRNKTNMATRKRTLLGHVHRVVSALDILPKTSTTGGQYVTPAQDCFSLLCIAEDHTLLLSDRDHVPVCKLPALLGLARLSNAQLSMWAKAPPPKEEIIQYYLQPNGEANEITAAHGLIQMSKDQ